MFILNILIIIICSLFISNSFIHSHKLQMIIIKYIEIMNIIIQNNYHYFNDNNDNNYNNDNKLQMIIMIISMYILFILKTLKILSTLIFIYFIIINITVIIYNTRCRLWNRCFNFVWFNI
jgi:hypothetical protein